MLNRVILMGRLTADPEQKRTPSGVSVTSFSIAVERNYADKSTGNRETDFINIVAWRGTADLICRYFSKGRMIAVEGSIQTRSYEDRSGNKRTAFEVIADSVHFTGEKKNDTVGTNIQSDNTAHQDFSMGDFEEIEIDDDDLPF